MNSSKFYYKPESFAKLSTIADYTLTSDTAKYRIKSPRIRFSRPPQLEAFRYLSVNRLSGLFSINSAAMGPSQKS